MCGGAEGISRFNLNLIPHQGAPSTLKGPGDRRSKGAPSKRRTLTNNIKSIFH